MNKTKKKKAPKRPIDRLFDALIAHPFLFVATVCALLLPFGMAQLQQITPAGIVTESVIWILAALALVVFGKPSQDVKINLLLIFSPVVLSVLFSVMVNENTAHGKVMFVPVLVGLVILGLALHRENALNTDRVVLLMILLGVVVRYCYVLRYSSTEMQHDAGSFASTAGHESYIMYWYNNGLKMPDFNVTTRWQYYHPPLHHMLMAALLHIFTSFGVELKEAQEAIQILPMLYSSLTMVVCYRIFKLVKLEGKGLIVAMSIACFYPTFIIWSGAYNNDMLASFLSLLAILWTLKWVQHPTLLYILPIALSVGFGMMAKLSAWMVAPAIAIVFLWVFIQNIKKPLPFIGQFAAFGAVCAPLGLWWGIRNFVTFHIPFTYVPDPHMQQMSLKAIPTAKRLFDFGASQFNYPFEAFTMYGAPYNEYNPLIALLKTSIFDEYHKPWDFNEMATVFVIAAAVLAVISVVCLVWMLCQKKMGPDFRTKVFFTVVFLTTLISYYGFCFRYPYVCSENIRFCIPIIPILAMALGFGVNRFTEPSRK